jgi:anti-anti-sigma regulatory factor
MSSAGLRALYAMFIELRAVNADLSEADMHTAIGAGTYKSQHLKVLNMSRNTKVAFDTAGFDMFIETFTDLETAVASF